MTTLWVAITALAMVAAWNFGAILRLQRRIEQLTWLNIANPYRGEQPKTRWPPPLSETAPGGIPEPPRPKTRPTGFLRARKG